MTSLKTKDKSTLVGAINELYQKCDSLSSDITKANLKISQHT